MSETLTGERLKNAPRDQESSPVYPREYRVDPTVKFVMNSIAAFLLALSLRPLFEALMIRNRTSIPGASLLLRSAPGLRFGFSFLRARGWFYTTMPLPLKNGFRDGRSNAKRSSATEWSRQGGMALAT